MDNIVRFHGMPVVSDNDDINVRNHYVIEFTSSGKLVCRYYDENGSEENYYPEVDVLGIFSSRRFNVTEANITGYIKRQITEFGRNKGLLISESAAEYIHRLANDAD